MSLDEELPNKGLYVEFIVRIDDVTDQILEGVTDAMTEKEKQSNIDGNSNKVQKNALKEDWQDTKVKAFYKGNQYFLSVSLPNLPMLTGGAPTNRISL